MNIIGPDTLVFGVDDVDACARYLVGYGLKPVSTDEWGQRFEALDGTGVVLFHQDDPMLPPSLGTASMLRKTVYGVDNGVTLEAIAHELKRDREVRRLPNGSLETVDDMGCLLGFQVSVRRPVRLAEAALPRSLSNALCFVPDAARAEAFYVERLGFVCTDRPLGAGSILRPGGTDKRGTWNEVDCSCRPAGAGNQPGSAGERGAAEGEQLHGVPCGRHQNDRTRL